MAEGEGFEPSKEVSPLTSLAIEGSPMMQNLLNKIDVDGTVLVNNVRVMTMNQNGASLPELWVSESLEPV